MKKTKTGVTLEQLREWKQKELRLEAAKRETKHASVELKEARKAAASISKLEKQVAAAEKRLTLCQSAVKKDKAKAKAKGCTLPNGVQAWQGPNWIAARILRAKPRPITNDRPTVDNP